MGDYSKVSLGFAEFVSQLLHETFDAVLSAQNYQLEKYSELEKALSISTEKFRELYISDLEINDKISDIFGFSISENMIITDVVLAKIKSVVEVFDQKIAISNKKLTSIGVEILLKEAIRAIELEKKEDIRIIVNKFEMVRLIVESGEIRAKLELTNIYQNENTEPKVGEVSKRIIAPQAPLNPTNNEQNSKLLDVNIPLVNGLKSKDLIVKEIIDPITNQKTIVIDKSELKKNVTVSSTIPNIRLVVNPAQVTSNSSLLSEVIIKFKTA